MIQAVWGLMDTAALKRYRGIRRNDFVSAIAAMIGVLLFGPLYGLLIAIGQALLGLVYRFSRIELDVMGRVPDEKAAWGSIRNHPERRTYDGIVVVRLDAPLFWANASDACDGVLACVQEAGDDVRAVLLDLEATSQLDITSIDALELLLQRLQDRGIDLYLVRVSSGQADAGARRFIERLGEERMWHSISTGCRRPVRRPNCTVARIHNGPRCPTMTRPMHLPTCLGRRAHSRGAQLPRRLRGPRPRGPCTYSKKPLVALELRAR